MSATIFKRRVQGSKPIRSKAIDDDEEVFCSAYLMTLHY